MRNLLVAGRRHVRGAGRVALLGAAALVVGCTPFETSDGTDELARTDSLARARTDSVNRAQPGYVVDSILPVAEELRRFRESIGGTPVHALGRASDSRDALVARALRALLAVDTADLSAMTLTAREFADLVYPESRYARPPLRQAPGLVWSLIEIPGRTGRRRAEERVGGLPLHLASYSCRSAPDREGDNIVWPDCVAILADAQGRVESHRLFGSILERDGRFKIISWSGEF